ncbi:peptide ABC transporter ATP-binding protein [Niveispirillum sp.]|uniref:peptide ABC transporter ATP-binding protein n=1 Tax=Niveispirillum sp. TaxID=1917217 RepID=UPI001B512B90|nr:peptide ABC transporter ATP-binding protein [Niveispirillum sp.]MBP7337629.1 ABC transporter ATP-binding protein [Niveispirillum sp.]
MTIILEARDLKRHYRVKRGLFRASATVKAVDGASFTVHAGKTLAIVGESGCGKSTLARLLTRIEAPTEGTIHFDGRDITSVPKAEEKSLRRAVQMVFQNPYGSLNPRQKVADILAEPLLINTDTPKAERRDRAIAMMQKVGLRPDQADRYPHMFSGGQRQRIAIARALMLDPRVVVADEPVSALDISIQAQVLNLMMDLQDEFGLAYVFISHDLSVVRHIADEVMVMYLGRPVEQGPKDAIFADPRHPYTSALLAAMPRVHRGGGPDVPPLSGELPSPMDPPTGCAFHKRCPLAQPRCAQETPEPRVADGRMVACHLVA